MKSFHRIALATIAVGQFSLLVTARSLSKSLTLNIRDTNSDSSSSDSEESLVFTTSTATLAGVTGLAVEIEASGAPSADESVSQNAADASNSQDDSSEPQSNSEAPQPGPEDSQPNSEAPQASAEDSQPDSSEPSATEGLVQAAEDSSYYSAESYTPSESSEDYYQPTPVEAKPGCITPTGLAPDVPLVCSMVCMCEPSPGTSSPPGGSPPGGSPGEVPPGGSPPGEEPPVPTAPEFISSSMMNAEMGLFGVLAGFIPALALFF